MANASSPIAGPGTEQGRCRDGLVWGLWGLYAVVVACLMYNGPRSYQIYSVYHAAGGRWLAGEPLYDGTGWGFIYLPQSAVLFSPFSCLPYPWAATLCRILNIAVFAVGVRRFLRYAGRDGSVDLFLPGSLLIMPLAITSARHGQMTLAMGAMMLLAIPDLLDRRWWRAALWLTLGLALKPLIVVLVLLVVVLYPQVSWRLAVGLAALLAFPFLTQHPWYVLEQYRQCVQMFDDAQKYALTHAGEYAQLFWMLKSVGVDIPEIGQTALRLLAAVLALAVCQAVRPRCTPSRFAVLLLTISVVYLLLFNPRTERNTYSLLAPSLALFAVQAFSSGRRIQAAALLGIVAFYFFSYPLGKYYFGSPTVWIKPLLCLLFVVVAGGQFYRELTGRKRAEEAGKTDGPARAA
jgi:hypothetical protein